MSREELIKYFEQNGDEHQKKYLQFVLSKIDALNGDNEKIHHLIDKNEENFEDLMSSANNAEAQRYADKQSVWTMLRNVGKWN